MKDLNDILAAYETRHNRAVKVMTKLQSDITSAAYVLALLETGKNADKLKVVRQGLLDGLQDVAEIMDGFKQDVIDFLEADKAELLRLEEKLNLIEKASQNED